MGGGHHAPTCRYAPRGGRFAIKAGQAGPELDPGGRSGADGRARRQRGFRGDGQHGERLGTWPTHHEHRAPQLQGEAVYGLTELYRERIAAARLVACPGCYPTAALLALVPLAKARLIDVDDIVIDAKSGVTGAGRGLKQSTLFSEAGEGLSPYSVATHRHSPEIDQELGVAAGTAVTANFTPHLIPMSRGELCTCYVKLDGASADDLRGALQQSYRDQPFVHVAKEGVLPQTQNVRGSNYVQIGVFADRIKNRAIVVSVLDNLVKGSAGQAIQNMNLMFGFPETAGLEQIALFP